VLHILTDTSLFLPLPNGCFCQVTGPPLVYTKPPQPVLSFGIGQDTKAPQSSRPTKRKESPEQTGGRPLKRQRTSSHQLITSQPTVVETKKCADPMRARTVLLTTILRRTAADITFPRARLLYSRASNVTNTNRQVVGLPVKRWLLLIFQKISSSLLNFMLDVLNEIKPAYRGKQLLSEEGYQDPDPKAQAMHARLLSKYVFPRQYGLPSAFAQDPSLPAANQSRNQLQKDQDIQARASRGHQTGDELMRCDRNLASARLPRGSNPSSSYLRV
jgi:telomerase reverse transcriptase